MNLLYKKINKILKFKKIKNKKETNNKEKYSPCRQWSKNVDKAITLEKIQIENMYEESIFILLHSRKIEIMLTKFSYDF